MLDVQTFYHHLFRNVSHVKANGRESELEEDEDDELSWMSDTKKADEPTVKQVTQVLNIYLFIHLFVYLFITMYLFIYSFIYLF